jgi:hypothetical protein
LYPIIPICVYKLPKHDNKTVKTLKILAFPCHIFTFFSTETIYYMSSKAKWKESFQKARSFSQTSSTSVTRKTSLLEEGDLSFSDDELEQYLGTIKKKSGLNRLWTGNTFGRVIDRTPDVSISSVSDGEGS